MNSHRSTQPLLRIRLSLIAVLLLLLAVPPVFADTPVGNNGLAVPNPSTPLPQREPLSEGPAGNNGAAVSDQSLTVPPVSLLSPVPVGELWQEFSFSTAGVPAAACTSCTPSSAGNSTFAGSPPWTFSALDAVDLHVVDAFASGDVFQVFDFGVSVGTTSPSATGHACGSDPAVCQTDALMSSGVFRLAAGPHSITIVPVVSSPGAAYFRVRPVVPVGGLWQEFSFSAVGVPAAACTGCTPSSAGNSEYAANPPWTLTTSTVEDLHVVDAFASGDVFQVFDFGIAVGVTSASATGHVCVSDPAVCETDPLMSRGVFRLAPGHHSITIVPTTVGSPGAAYFRVYTHKAYLPLLHR